MKWKVLPSTLSGAIRVPPSKSHTIRAIVAATLVKGESKVIRPLTCGDGASALGAAQSFGAEIEKQDDALVITGIGGDFSRGSDSFDMGNSGTSTNLFTSAVALGARPRRIDGDGSLRRRPVRPLLEALGRLGAQYTNESPGQDLPFTIRGPLQGGATTVSGISSQFVSSLLFSTPLAPRDTEITVTDLHEIPYIELTLWWLTAMGIRYEHAADFSGFRIPGGQSYRPFTMEIPGDFSSATFSAVAAAVTGGIVDVTGVDFTDPQGDKKIFDVLEAVGVPVSKQRFSARVGAAQFINGVEIDLNTMPDALPAVAVLGCVAGGITRIVNVGHARIKETDRIKVMAEELTKMGARITEEKDGLTIKQSGLKGALVNGHDDHRVVMALALAGMVAQGETIIDTAQAAEVTYPGFVEDFARIGARISVVEE